MKDLAYSDRLKALKLPSLGYRRFRGDLIEMYKICHNKYDPVTTNNLFDFVPVDNITRNLVLKFLSVELIITFINTFSLTESLILRTVYQEKWLMQTP